MCFAWLILDKPDSNKEKYYLVLKMLEKGKGNEDGYFIAFGNSKIRTLNKEDYLAFIKSHKEEIDKASMIAGHMRMASSGGTSEQWVHGWKFANKFYAYHNGISYGYANGSKENDSFRFFSKLFKKSNEKPDKKDIQEELNKGINGAFFLASEDRKLIFSKNHEVYLYLIDELQLITSQKVRIKELKEPIEESFTKTISKGKIDYSRTLVKAIDNPLANKPILTAKFDNRFLVFDSSNECITNEGLELKPINIYNYITHDTKKDKWSLNYGTWD
jgi:hypothetical protein